MPVKNAREAFFEVARDEGARYLFTNPGTTELPIFDELVEPASGLDLVLCLHEGVAMGAADGYAQATNRPSLVNLHILPGLANGICGMANAAWSRSPVVVTAGQQDTRHLIQEPMLAGDLVGLAKPFAKWAYECRRPDEVPTAMRRAFKTAASPPSGPTFVSIPWDTMDEETPDLDVPPKTQIDYGAAADTRAIDAAVNALLQAERPLIVAGDGVARGGAQGVYALVKLAEAIGARVAGEPVYGRLVFPHDHPLWLSGMYPTNAFIRGMLSQFDVVLVAGGIAFAPLQPTPMGAVPPGVRMIQIDEDPYQIAKTYPVEHGLWGNVAATIEKMAGRAVELRSDAQAQAIAQRTKQWAEERDANVAGLGQAIEAQRDMVPIKPLVAAAEALQACEPGTRIVDDAVTSTAFVRLTMRNSEPGTYFFTRGGGLGWGMPAAIGVKLADPSRPVLAIVGDGTAMYTPQALWTMAHHDVPVVTVVLNNRSYLILKQGMQSMAGKAAKADVYPGMDIVDPPVDFLPLARSMGVDAERIEKASEIQSAVASALKANKPALIEIDVDGSLGG
jgi:benzoylformate decarboxylase